MKRALFTIATACLLLLRGFATDETEAKKPDIRSQAEFEKSLADLERQYANDRRGLWEAQGRLAQERQREIEAWLASNPDSPEAEAFRQELDEINEELAERAEAGFDEVDKADNDETEGESKLEAEFQNWLKNGTSGGKDIGGMFRKGASILDSVPGLGKTMEGMKDIQGQMASGAISESASRMASSGKSSKSRPSVSASSLLVPEETDEEEGDRPVTAADITPDLAPVLDDAPYNGMAWDFGGFDGEKAEMRGVLIGDLKMQKDGLSFSYDTDLSGWGLAEDDASGALACLFVMDKDGKWVGGKFDWISSSRKTRDFKNVYSGYNGWDLSNVPQKTTAAFVIVSADGRKRSNVITAVWER